MLDWRDSNLRWHLTEIQTDPTSIFGLGHLVTEAIRKLIAR